MGHSGGHLKASFLYLTLAYLALFPHGLEAKNIELRGTIVDPSSSSIEDALVTLTQPAHGYAEACRIVEGCRPYEQNTEKKETKTDSRGHFVLDVSSPGPWDIELRRDPEAPALHGLLLILEDLTLGDVVLPSTRRIQLQIVGDEGQPIDARLAIAPSAELSERTPGLGIPWSTRERWADKAQLKVTDTQGNVFFQISDTTAWTVEIAAPGYVSHRVTITSHGATQQTLALGRGIDHVIQLVDSSGQPLTDVLIYHRDGLVPLASTDARGLARVTTSQQGPSVFGWAMLDGTTGTRTLEGRHEREADREEQPAVERFEILETQQVHGKVIEKETTRPIPEALVFNLPRPSNVVNSDEMGGFHFPGSDNRVRLCAVAPGRALGCSVVRNSPGREVTLTLERGVFLGGRVVDSDGFPISGATIELGESLQRSLSDGFDRIDTRRAPSRPDGSFNFSALASDSYYALTANSDGYAPHLTVFGRLSESRDTLLLILQPELRGIGTVLTWDESPIIGARVVARPTGTPEHSREGEPSGISGEAGRFVVEHLAAGLVDLEASAPGYAPKTVRGVEIDPGEASERGDLDLGTILLSPGVRVEGVVVDTSGNPVPGVEVGLFQPQDVSTGFQRDIHENPRYQSTSDVEGHFVIGDLAPEKTSLLRARRTGYLPAEGGLVTPPADHLELMMTPAARIQGTVTDSTGSPISPAVVIAWNAEGGRYSMSAMLGPRPRVLTDDEGQFVLEGVPTGRVGLTVSSDRHPPLNLSDLVIDPGESLELDLELKEGAVLYGAIRLATGKAASNAKVTIENPAARYSFVTQTRADGAGNYQLSNLAVGKYLLIAESETGRKASKMVTIREGEQRANLTFEPGSTVEGSVFDTSRSPVAGTIVDLVEQGSGLGATRLRTRSDNSGTFAFSEISPGSYTLSAAERGYAPQSLTLEIDDTPVEGVELVLDGGVSLSGQVIGPDENELPLVAIKVLGLSQIGYTNSAIHPDFNGRYHIDHLPHGVVEVEAWIPATGRTVRESVELPEGVSEIEHDLIFGKGYTLTGSASYGGQPVSKGWILYFSTESRHSGKVSLDHQGNFQIENLRLGKYRLELVDHETGARHTREIDVQGNDYLRLDIDGGRVAGWVRSPGGEGISEVVVFIRPASGSGTAEQRGVTDSAGRFDLGQVEAGSWVLIALKEGAPPIEIPIWVEAGSPIDDLELTLASGS